MKHRSRLPRWAVIAAVASGLLAAPRTAEAQAFGPSACGGGCPYADNNNHTFFYVSVSLSNVTATESARVNSLNPTDMNSTVQTSSYNSDTDVLVEDGRYLTGPAAGYPGVWRCYSRVTGNSSLCQQGHFLINDEVKGTDGSWPLACQELGHSLGLDHSASTGSCMYQNIYYSAKYYDTHDKAHINGFY